MRSLEERAGGGWRILAGIAGVVLGLLLLLAAIEGVQGSHPTSWLSLVGTLLGFFSGWLLFEVSERRRRQMQQRAIRRALKAELEDTEYLLSQMVFKFAWGADDPRRGIQEMRWYFSKGLDRARLLEPLPNDFSSNSILDKSDEELSEILKRLPQRQESVGIDLPLLVLHAVLAAPTSGFTSEEIRDIGWVKWQAHLLAHEARMMREMVMLTFTVADPENHQRIVENHRNGMRTYRMRAEYTLDAVRAALKTLAKTSS